MRSERIVYFDGCYIFITWDCRFTLWRVSSSVSHRFAKCFARVLTGCSNGSPGSDLIETAKHRLLKRWCLRTRRHKRKITWKRGEPATRFMLWLWGGISSMLSRFCYAKNRACIQRYINPHRHWKRPSFFTECLCARDKSRNKTQNSFDCFVSSLQSLMQRSWFSFLALVSYFLHLIENWKCKIKIFMDHC